MESVRSALFTAQATVADEATIYEDNTGANGGSYSEFCVGNLTGTAATRRGFIRYTLPSIPTGSMITRVQLTFTQNDVRAKPSPLAATLEVQRATSSWVEGTGVSGSRSCGGGSVVTGSVSWDTQPSVAATLSGTAALSSSNPVTITLDTDVGTINDGLIADVQAWVDGAANDGWRLSVAEEGTADNARTITPGGLGISWTVPNGSACTSDSNCTDGNCVHPDGLDCAARSGCVCCNVATCVGACNTCQRAGLLGTCSPSANGTVCRAGTCSGGIATSEGTCDGSSTSCPGPVAQACTPYLCSGTICATSCSGLTNCDTGHYCNGGLCELIPDGGIPDAGSPDAGVADAGTDAGVGDAGVGDAGLGDAGVTDAGFDAGTADAGTSDAGTNDAGTADAGTSDAGTSDAGTGDGGTTDAGNNADVDAGTGADAGAPPRPDAGDGTPPPNTGCGCGATGPGPLAFALLLLLRRRRR